MNALLSRELPWILSRSATTIAGTDVPAESRLRECCSARHVEHAIDLSHSFIVGDRGSDIEAGASAGCKTFLIEQPYSRCNEVKPTWKATDLLDVARKIEARLLVPATQDVSLNAFLEIGTFP